MRRLILALSVALLLPAWALAQTPSNAPIITPGNYLPGGVAIGGISVPDWFQLRTVNTAAPSAGDCNAAGQTGRMYWDSTNDMAYLCSGASGWVQINAAGTGYWARSGTVISPTVNTDSVSIASLGIGTTGITNAINLGNTGAQIIWIENTAGTVAGKALSLIAGSTVAGGTNNLAGGTLTLQAGLGVGTGASSIIFQTGGVLGSGTTLQTPTTALTLNNAQNALFAGNAAFGVSTLTRSVNANTTIGITPGGASQAYILLEQTTGAAFLAIQAGAGSAGYGGGINLYGHTHGTFPGWVKAGISSGSGGKFSVNTFGTGGGTDVFTVDAVGHTVITGGTNTTDVPFLNIAGTMNAVAIAFNGIYAKFTEGASGTAAGTNLINLLYGTSGAEVSMFSVSKTGALKTAAGVSYDFGAVTTAAAVLDATKYVNVTIGGVAYKLAIIQ